MTLGECIKLKLSSPPQKIIRSNLTKKNCLTKLNRVVRCWQTPPNAGTQGISHLCFNITEKGQMIVPDWCNRIVDYTKLDGVGHVDNRPSPTKLHHLTCDTWHVTRDTWHVTCDMFWEANIPSKFQLPIFYCLWFMILWRSGGKGSLN